MNPPTFLGHQRRRHTECRGLVVVVDVVRLLTLNTNSLSPQEIVPEDGHDVEDVAVTRKRELEEKLALEQEKKKSKKKKAFF